MRDCELGFTGTQRGMTPIQRKLLTSFLDVHKITLGTFPPRLHHGDCVGADNEVNDICFAKGILRIHHPPTDERKRAFGRAELIMKPKDYLERNKDIVDAAMMLIAAPAQKLEQRRSGTWSTIRYAQATFTPVLAIYPDGDHDWL